MSGNLAITLITASQNQKEVTANAAITALDAALTETLEVSVASGNGTVTSAQWRAALHIRATGASVAGRTVTLPAVERIMVLSVDAASTETVDFVRGSATVSVAPGNAALVRTDGTTNGLLALIDSPGGAVSSSLDTISSTRGAVLYRGASAWQALTPGTSGQVLTTAGAGADPAWDDAPPASSFAISLSVLGLMEDDEWLAVIPITSANEFRLPSGGAGTSAVGLTAATGSTTVTIYKNGSSVGTLVWSAAGTVAAVTVSSDVDYEDGDTFRVKAPATADATLADVGFTFALQRI